LLTRAGDDAEMRPNLALLYIASLGCGSSPVMVDAVGGGDAAGDAITASQRCALISASITAAGFGGAVAVTCDDTYAYLASDTYPAHTKMTGIAGTNDQVPVPAPGYRSPVRLAPVRGSAPISIDAALGIAVNGVPIYDYSSQGNVDLTIYDPAADTVITGELDACHGHAGRGDDYHYHASPTCMIAAMANRGPEAVLGWAFDGYPIYGDANPDGSAIAPGELDLCNAKADPTYGLRYHTSPTPPYIVQCLEGEFDLTMAPRVPPLSGPMGGRPPGTKPPGGVTHLTLTEGSNGSRTMSYDHVGQTYHITYSPSTPAGCWDFDEQTYTTGGVRQANTYCRGAQ
jgi:hypothetical protein